MLRPTSAQTLPSLISTCRTRHDAGNHLAGAPARRADRDTHRLRQYRVEPGSAEGGAVGYLAKPVQTEKVVATLLGRGDDSAEPAERPMSANRVRWEHIQRVFEQCNRNVSETARRLGMHRRTLDGILKKRAPRQ